MRIRYAYIALAFAVVSPEASAPQLLLTNPLRIDRPSEAVEIPLQRQSARMTLHGKTNRLAV